MPKLAASDFKRKKAQKERIIVLTAYDYFCARLIQKAGLDAILVGDSLAMVALGYENTLPVTMDEMVHHSKAVRRGAPDMFMIGDLPYEALRGSPGEALEAAERFLEEGGCDAVKVEGAYPEALEAVRLMRRKKIEVMGHLGLLPQVLLKDGKPLKAQGRDPNSARRILDEARKLAGLEIFSLVLECIPADLAAELSREHPFPTIGIGAGPHTDGQILVTDDILGRYDRLKPKHVKQYLNSIELSLEAISKFKQEVQAGSFPTQAHSF
ncbi:MAG: 3-methyl-2-oxobutanoate hydroxymethyltransferase [Candidatus Omnitrophica bacterium]|nr:3-methyl-2-oxobutanoate hydroxymethyltransferase [Candidatus Omnitrophota bacterium]